MTQRFDATDSLREFNKYISKKNFKDAAKLAKEMEKNMYTHKIHKPDRVHFQDLFDRAVNRAWRYGITDGTKEDRDYIMEMVDSSKNTKYTPDRPYNESKSKSLVERVFSFLSIGFIASGIVLGSFSLTGNVIAESTNKILDVGIGLFILGLVGSFILSKKN